MIEAGVLLVGIILGYLLCYIATNRHTTLSKSRDENTVMVKRSRMSLRSPLQTNRVQYDKFKTRGTGLYSPVKPKSDKKEDVEVGN